MDGDPVYQTIVDSITEAFEVMLMVDLEFLPEERYDEDLPCHYVATIHLAGDGVEGVLNLRIGQAAAQMVVALMLGEEDANEEMVQDGLGELANLVAGGIKKRLTEQDLVLSISLPSVTAGSGEVSSDGATTVYPFQFVIESEHQMGGLFLFTEVNNADQASNLELSTGD